MKILFITKNYPPIQGGMEKYSFDLYNSIKSYVNADLIANTKGKKKLILFLFKTKLKLLFNDKNYTHIHLCDGFMSILIPFLKLKFPKSKISITIHGLDIIYNKFGYQIFFPKLINKADKIICVSNNTINECVKRGLEKNKCIFIPNGFNLSKLKKTNIILNDIERKYNIILSDKKILFSIGRLIKRKGNEWFIINVMPNLSNKYVYLIAGVGCENKNIKKAIITMGLSNKVFMLGKISDEEKMCLYNNSYLFIMPNIKIEYDVEGFGITLVEAGICGLPIIASDLDGIPDAVIDKKTGYLVKEKNIKQFVDNINNCELNKDEIIMIVKKSFNWDNLAKKYVEDVFT